MSTNLRIDVINETSGEAYPVTDWSVTRSMSATFATAALKFDFNAIVKLRDEIKLLLHTPDGYGVQHLMYGYTRALGYDDSNELSVTLESGAGIMAESDAAPNDWTYNTARDAIEAIAGEFDIPVTWDEDNVFPDTVPAEVAIDAGTRALQVVVDICRRNGWVVYDDPGYGGGLMITTVGAYGYVPVLTRGLPPLISGSFSAEDKRIQVVKANRQLPGRERRGKKLVEDIDLWGTATDEYGRPGTRRYIRSDTATTEGELQAIAASMSLAEGAGGMTYTATVDTILAPDGLPWEPNRLITVSDPTRKVLFWRGLIDSVTLSQSATQGQRANLTIVPPALYLTQDLDAQYGATLTDPFKGLNVNR